MTPTATYIAQSAAATPTLLAPPSLADNPALLAWNLFVMTCAACLGLMMVGKMVRRIWAHRLSDHPTDPVTLYRLILLLPACALTSRAGVEAAILWAGGSNDILIVARMTEVKRWVDPASIGFGLAWMALAVLAEPMLEHQLRKAPLPIDMWSRWPQLRKPLMVVIVSFLMAAAAVGLR